MFFLSDILGHAVLDSADRKVGVLHDVVAHMGPSFPVVTKVRVRVRRRGMEKPRLQFVSWSEVLGMEGPNLILRTSLPAEERQLHERELLLWKNVLDKQMVDVSGRKVVRVNDVVLGTIGRTARVTGVAIGGAAMLRRLGFLRFARLLPFWKLRDTVVPWESVVPLDYTATNVQLNVQMERLAKLRTADLAQILSEMSRSEQSMVLDSLDDETVADIIEEFEPKEQAQLLEAIEEERVADVVAAMEPDDAADMLQELSPEETANILEQMEEEEAEDVKELMEAKHWRSCAALPASYRRRTCSPSLPSTTGVLSEESPTFGISWWRRRKRHSPASSSQIRCSHWRPTTPRKPLGSWPNTTCWRSRCWRRESW
jgi:magnesium transporter